jgi:hypothetical protein
MITQKWRKNGKKDKKMAKNGKKDKKSLFLSLGLN